MDVKGENNMYQVKGRWALITGAARGIGYLTALFMAKQGCNLILRGPERPFPGGADA